MSGSKKKEERSNGSESSDFEIAKEHLEKSYKLLNILVEALPEGYAHMHVSVAAALLSSMSAIEAGLDMDRFIIQCIALYSHNKQCLEENDS